MSDSFNRDEDARITREISARIFKNGYVPMSFPSDLPSMDDFFKRPTVVQKTRTYNFEISTVHNGRFIETIIFTDSGTLHEPFFVNEEDVAKYHRKAKKEIKRFMKRLRKISVGNDDVRTDEASSEDYCPHCKSEDCDSL